MNNTKTHSTTSTDINITREIPMTLSRRPFATNSRKKLQTYTVLKQTYISTILMMKLVLQLSFDSLS